MKTTTKSVKAKEEPDENFSKLMGKCKNIRKAINDEAIGLEMDECIRIVIASSLSFIADLADELNRFDGTPKMDAFTELSKCFQDDTKVLIKMFKEEILQQQEA